MSNIAFWNSWVALQYFYHFRSIQYHASSLGPSLTLRLAILAVLRLEPDSLGILAPVCSSMGFLASSISLRSFMLPLGDEEKSFVQVGNLLAIRPPGYKYRLYSIVCFSCYFPHLCYKECSTKPSWGLGGWLVIMATCAKGYSPLLDLGGTWPHVHLRATWGFGFSTFSSLEIFLQVHSCRCLDSGLL